METIWAPWRLGYIVGETSPPPQGATGCIFCDKPGAGDDRAHLIVARAVHCFVLMNLYPYNNGHIMVAPYRHVARLEDLPDNEIAELMQVARRVEPVLRAKIKPDGFNIGMNVGRVAGAGIDAHLHMHMVPRWSGDTNFMPVISDTKVIPQALEAMRDFLAEAVQEALNDLAGMGDRP